MTSEVDTQGIARGILRSVSDDEIVLSIPGTDYRLHLTPSVPAAQITAPVGRPIRGVIEAVALRIHTAEGGGRFIEPIYGAPRIVAGEVLYADEVNRRVLVDVSVPMWVSTQLGQDFSILREGELVNFYVASGTRFTPASSDHSTA
ncbi:MAG: hypothetical protein KC983_00670 [Phycisphaerales bacterium]|nr:hypothetical protein [Phycisphaerales bacterium]